MALERNKAGQTKIKPFRLMMLAGLLLGAMHLAMAVGTATLSHANENKEAEAIVDKFLKAISEANPNHGIIAETCFSNNLLQPIIKFAEPLDESYNIYFYFDKKISIFLVDPMRISPTQS